jgi:hypothetical protein
MEQQQVGLIEQLSWSYRLTEVDALCVYDTKIILAEVQGKSTLRDRCAAGRADRVMMFTDRGTTNVALVLLA